MIICLLICNDKKCLVLRLEITTILINTLSLNHMIDSLANIFSVPRESIIHYMSVSSEEIANCDYNEITITQLSLNQFRKGIGSTIMSPIKSIVVNHISPRISTKGVLEDDILTLPRVLTEKTELSDYLVELGYKFEIDNNCIVASLNGTRIDWSKLHPNNLLIRFGGKHSLYDFNINGYLFTEYVSFQECRNWLGSPEILKSISMAFDDHSIADNFANKCENYMFSFIVPINYFDIGCTKNDMTAEEKGELLLKYIINAAACSINEVPYCNQHILLSRDYCVSKRDVNRITKLVYNNTYVKSDGNDLKHNRY